MSDQTERLDAIEANVERIRDFETNTAERERAYLLDLARKQQAALAKVELACDAMDAGVAIRSGDPRTKSHAAGAIRAAIREAMGDV